MLHFEGWELTVGVAQKGEPSCRGTAKRLPALSLTHGLILANVFPRRRRLSLQNVTIAAFFHRNAFRV